VELNRVEHALLYLRYLPYLQILAAYLAHLYFTEEEDFMSLVPDCRILVCLDCDLRLLSGVNFIKLWKKRKVPSKFFEAFFGIQQKILTNFVRKCFGKMAFLSFAQKSRASGKKAMRKLLMKLTPGLHRHLRLRCHARRPHCLAGHAPQSLVQVGRSTS